LRTFLQQKLYNIYTKTNAKASTSAKTSANAKTSVKGGGKTNLRTFSFFCSLISVFSLGHFHQVKMAIIKKKRTTIYAGLKPA